MNRIPAAKVPAEPIPDNVRRAMRAQVRGEPLAACVRYYPNGDFRREDRIPDDVRSWTEWNMTWRPGNSLFVDGKCVCRGIGFTEADCTAIEKCLRSEARWEPKPEQEPDEAPAGPFPG